MKPERQDPRTPELEGLLGSARRPGTPDAGAEERALQAFREARDEGLLTRRVRWRRSRDDWRPAGVRHRARAFRALVAGVAAAVAFGGVAVAAGKGAITSPFGGGAGPEPVRSAPSEPGSDEERSRERREAGTPESPVRPTTPSADAAPHGRPATAKDTVAHCRVHLAADARRGTPPRGAALARLEEVAGGPEFVRAYCERLLEGEMSDTRPNPADGKRDGKPDGKPDVSPDIEPAKGQPSQKQGKPGTG
ncbi:hypothetical protein FBY35_2742 [Streptomyces sp. SLBN-118]|uniref:hypothetical protein n=1 Tax=Streptomyces sp. SLBN-118 TaxID=2768454 RepID=UPI001152523D|nr:hypothetical protein [Streptomyces sp. SLBN-118]TQK52311.1 hypothetical protein FBY35_2742 [Streptomyces sp. SLBN-118]